MEQNLNNKNEKTENEIHVNNIQNILEDESEKNNKNKNLLIDKEQINENVINHFTEILSILNRILYNSICFV